MNAFRSSRSVSKFYEDRQRAVKGESKIDPRRALSRNDDACGFAQPQDKVKRFPIRRGRMLSVGGDLKVSVERPGGTTTYGKPLRVNRSYPCPVCSHIDWCTVSHDGRIAFCMRVPAASFKTAKNGAYMHRLTGERVANTYADIQQIEVVESPLAPLQRRDVIYRAMVDEFELRTEHKAELHRRGLSDAAITRNGYRSTVTERRGRELAIKFARIFNLHQVPGFFLEGKNWRMNHMPNGFFIPVRNAEGMIQALAMRRTDGRAGNKYL